MKSSGITSALIVVALVQQHEGNYGANGFSVTLPIPSCSLRFPLMLSSATIPSSSDSNTGDFPEGEPPAFESKDEEAEEEGEVSSFEFEDDDEEEEEEEQEQEQEEDEEEGYNDNSYTRSVALGEAYNMAEDMLRRRQLMFLKTKLVEPPGLAQMRDQWYNSFGLTVCTDGIAQVMNTVYKNVEEFDLALFTATKTMLKNAIKDSIERTGSSPFREEFDDDDYLVLAFTDPAKHSKGYYVGFVRQSDKKHPERRSAHAVALFRKDEWNKT